MTAIEKCAAEIYADLKEHDYLRDFADEDTQARVKDVAMRIFARVLGEHLPELADDELRRIAAETNADSLTMHRYKGKWEWMAIHESEGSVFADHLPARTLRELLEKVNAERAKKG